MRERITLISWGLLVDIWRDAWSYVAPILMLIGGVAFVGASLAGAAYGLFKLFSEKWLQAKVDERLAAYKHEQQKELEELRFKIARLMDRATKFHQREFKVLPEAWARLSELYSSTVAFVSRIQMHPNLDHMSPENLEDFISQCNLRNWQKDELRKSSNKTQYYANNIFWYKLHNIRGSLQDCHLYFVKNSILVPKAIRDKFIEIEHLISNAITECQLNHSHELIPQMSEDIKKLQQEGDTLISELEKTIENRLSSLESIDL